MKAVASLGLALCASATFAADSGDVACRTTIECHKQAEAIGTTIHVPNVEGNTTSDIDRAEDIFYWTQKINKASVVMLMEEKIFPPQTGQLIAKGIAYAVEQADKPGGKRPSDVIQHENLITGKVGEEASVIHAGRSRQDMYATYRAAKLRNQFVDYTTSLLGLRERLLGLATNHVETLIPAYTNGVQAVPISYAHYLLAFEGSFARDVERSREAFKRLNRSAMGTAVLSNSVWPLNRPRLAQLLGFDGVIENSLDASQISPSDTSLEALAIASSGAIRIGALTSDLHTQYHQVTPWFLLAEGRTYSSSAMPQKRNPGFIMRAREAASNVVGLAQTVTFRGHNVTTGMTDYKEPWADLAVFPAAVRMVAATNAVLEALVVNPARALEELEAEWTTTMNLAEILLRDHQIPFRIGHRFSSELVSAARPSLTKPKDFSYTKADQIFRQTLNHFKLPERALPMSEQAFRDALSARRMVEETKGIGGPQPAEVRRMLEQANLRLLQDKVWVQNVRARIQQADAQLEREFAKLLP
jgi:argininosuccinate lyase